jgi:hypothetical protein
MDYRLEAERRWPLSAKRRTITGSGPYVLVVKCTVPWSIIQFESEQDREKMYRHFQSQCGQKLYPCAGHQLVSLALGDFVIPENVPDLYPD